MHYSIHNILHKVRSSKNTSYTLKYITLVSYFYSTACRNFGFFEHSQKHYLLFMQRELNLGYAKLLTNTFCPLTVHTLFLSFSIAFYCSTSSHICLGNDIFKVKWQS